jgi:hypothetical protein
MRVYYLDTPLSLDEVRELEELMGWAVEQIRVPFLLPEGRGVLVDQKVPIAPLKAAGILKDYGQRCALVQMTSDTVYWTTQFTEAIGRLTGRWPYLIQTKSSLAAVGTDDFRVLDMDKAMRD